ncbi:MAG: aldo/keto reductase [Planctomycetota bacterium]|nr:aldo/keto reductase [Planctomycetota bacterium]
MPRQLGQTDIFVSEVVLGCWPIAGMTSADINDADSIATIQACFDLGINALDTAYCYGIDGESERLIAQALVGRRDQIVLATKGGIHWERPRTQVVDGRPETLRRELDESLRRLKTDRVELLYLHAPDPKIPLAESAGELRRLCESGKARSIGVSNMTLQQMQAFAEVCPISAYQPHYNMLQREIESDRIPWCQANQVSVFVYWPLMKGLLAGRIPRDNVFDTTDSRHKYPMFQGVEWQKNCDFVDRLRPIAEETGHTVAQLVINWTIHRPGVTAALCGAKRPQQIRETAGALGWTLTANQLQQIDEAIQTRGTPLTRAAV